jgi:CubicO group peptidase (beta-lactamase class C family)
MALLAAACSPPALPPQPVAPPARFAEPSLPPPVFADPARRDKLLAALPVIDQHLATQIDKWKLPGLAVGVVIDGELVHEKGFGVLDVDSRAPVTADSVFRIASMTKSFTAMAILKLRDEGRLSLEDPVDKHLPELRELAYPTRDSARITIRELLSHGEGFPEDNPWGDRQLAMTEEEFTKTLLKGIPFSNAPGVAFEYSNFGFALLGRVVTRVSAVPYRAYVTANILRPLGMTATVFDEREVPPGRLARGYRRESATLVPEVNLPDGAFGAMGGLYSSVRDMARYAAFHLAAWPPRDAPEAGPIRRSSAREMQQPARASGLFVARGTEDAPAGATASGYGFGFGSRETCDFVRVVSHGGGLPGYGSLIYMLPEHGVALVALANLTYGRAAQAVTAATQILMASGGLTRRTPVPAPSLLAARDAVGRLLERWDDGIANEAFTASFFLDRPAATVRKALEKLHSEHGACPPTTTLNAENALRGTWKLTCERGWIDLGVTLAPTMPPRIQALTERGSLPPSDRLKAAAARAAALTERWDDAGFADLFTPDTDRARTQKLFADTSFARGACKLGSFERGDGKTHAQFQLSCERAPIKIDVTLDEASGKVKEVRFAPLDARIAKCSQ